jgi:hypothetical protein
MTIKPDSLQEALKAAQQIVDHGNDIAAVTAVSDVPRITLGSLSAEQLEELRRLRRSSPGITLVIPDPEQAIAEVWEECAKLAESFGTEESNQIAEAIRIVANARRTELGLSH